MKHLLIKLFWPFLIINFHTGLAYSKPVALDVNDVSFMLPLINESSGDVNPFPKISLAEENFLPKEIFNQIIQYLNDPKSGVLTPDFTNVDIFLNLIDWRVVSVRYEPCGINFHRSPNFPERLLPELTCQETLRVVAQPVLAGLGMLDSSLHLIYTIGDQPQKISPAISDLITLKKLAKTTLAFDTNKLPLMPHPVLKKAQADPQGHLYVNPFVQFVRKYMKSENLKMITVIAKIIGPGWKFAGGTVENKKWTPFQTPVIEHHEVAQSEELSCNMVNGDCVVYPDELQKTAFTQAIMSKNQSSTEQIELTAELIDSAQTFNLFNVSCISCHESKYFRNTSQLSLTPPDKLNGITAFPIGTFNLKGKGRVMNFGYDLTGPIISTRVINESADVAAYVNNLSRLPNPGISCKNQDKRNATWKCLNNFMPDIQACLSICEPGAFLQRKVSGAQREDLSFE